MSQDIENAYGQFEAWLSGRPSMWNRRHETEYAGQFTDDCGKVCYIFKYRIMPSGTWMLGIVSGPQAYSISRAFHPATQAEDAELTLHYLKHHLEVQAMQDAMLEKYKDYKRGTCEGMSLQEKMDFLEGVQKEFIPIFDEDGDEMDTWCDFHSIEKEFKENPQMFTMENMVPLMHMFDDECFELDMMHQLAIIVRRIAVHYGTDGICFLLENFDEVPREGRWHGHFRIIQSLMTDDYMPLLKKAVLQCAQTGRERLLTVLGAYDFMDQEESVGELKALCNRCDSF